MRKKNKPLIFIGVAILLVFGFIFFSNFKSTDSSLNTFSVATSGFGGNNSAIEQGVTESFIENFLPLGVVYDRSCTPDSGYNYCYEYKYEYCYGSACARPNIKMQFYDPTKDPAKCQNNYCVGDLILKWYVSGADTLYIYNNSETNWNNFYNYIDCYKSSCDYGTEIAKTGEMVLAKPGQPTLNYCPKFVGIDYDKNTASNGDWCWSYAYLGYGWSSTSGSCNFYTQTCLSSTNFGCNSTSYCQGNSVCLPKECNTGQTKLNDTGYYTCENYKFVRKGNCQSGTKCVGLDSYTCTNYNWVNNGKIINQCGVECISGEGKGKTIGLFSVAQINLTAYEKCNGLSLSTCTNYTWKSNGTILGKCGVECSNNTHCYEESALEFKCSNGEIIKKSVNNYCSNSKCLSNNIEDKVKECKLGCGSEQGKCLEETSLFKNIIGGAIVIAIIISFLIYKIFFYKKGRK